MFQRGYTALIPTLRVQARMAPVKHTGCKRRGQALKYIYNVSFVPDLNLERETAMATMFCDQCEQTFRGTGCVERGICGKDADVESVQKILLYGLKGMAAYKHHARRLGLARYGGAICP